MIEKFLTSHSNFAKKEKNKYFFSDGTDSWILTLTEHWRKNKANDPYPIIWEKAYNPLNKMNWEEKIWKQPDWLKELYHQAIETFHKSERVRGIFENERRNLRGIFFSYSILFSNGEKIYEHFKTRDRIINNTPFERNEHIDRYIDEIKDVLEKERYLIVKSENYITFK